MRTMGKRIAELRRARELSQAELARKLAVTRGAVWNWENDEKFPSSRTQPKLARVLGTTIGWLHGERSS